MIEQLQPKQRRAIRVGLRPRNMRISQLPTEASKTDASGPLPGMDESLP